MSTRPEQRRSASWRTSLGPMLVLGAALLAAVLTSCVGPRSTHPSADRPDSTHGGNAPAVPPSGHWREVSRAPLESRSELVTAWVGDRFLVVGGSTAPPCPPNADCVAVPGADRREAAWYDPATDTWTLAEPPPVSIRWAAPTVVGTTLYLRARSTTGLPTLLAYDAARDTWRTLPDGPCDGELTSDGTRLLCAAPTDAPARPLTHPDDAVDPVRSTVGPTSPGTDAPGTSDAVLDAGATAWRTLPPDPGPPLTGRRFVVVDGHVLLVGTLAGTHVDPSTVARTDGDRSGTEGVGTERARTERAQTERARTEHGGPDGAHRVAPYLVRLRELSADLTTWSDLPEGEVVGSGPVAADGLLVWPSPQRQDGGEVDGWGRSYPEGGIYDPTTHSWHTLPDEYRARCDGSPTGTESTAVGPWVLGWGCVLDVVRGTVTPLAPPPWTWSDSPAIGSSPTAVLAWGGLADGPTRGWLLDLGNG